MMSLLRRRSNAAPAPAANGLSQNQANAALVKALHNVANVKLRNALKAAKNVANASAANKSARIKELEKALAEAKPVVTAATNAAPKPVEAATQNAELETNSAVITLIANIGKYNTLEQLSKVKTNQRYPTSNNNKARVNKAVNNRRFALLQAPLN